MPILLLFIFSDQTGVDSYCGCYVPGVVGSSISMKPTLTLTSTPTIRATFSRMHCNCRIPEMKRQ